MFYALGKQDLWLRVVALLALFVGAFVIYNTFSVIVAQRLREHMLAALIEAPKEPEQMARIALYQVFECVREDPRLARILFVEIAHVYAGQYSRWCQSGSFRQ